ncbi:MAG: ferritin [Desulfurococcales archaeon]|nr:ferritin [Desulfurococcales archaeon]
MIPKELQDELNKQLNRELYSAYLYLSMAAYFDYKGLSGFAHWMRVQAKEELEHAMKFYEFINDRGGRVELYKVDEPPREWKSVTDVFREALEHEKIVTKHINDLVDLARKLDDKPTEVFLHWFVTEQVEEEKIFQEILQLLEFSGETPQAVLMLNARLGQRKH